MLVGAEVDEQLVDVVERPRPARASRAIDLVDRDDHRQPARHRLLQDVAGLRQRALGGVHEEQHRVDHQQRPLDLAAEVGVAGRVDDVEADVAVVDRRLLGEDRDALLALEVARIEDPVDDGLVGAEGAGLAEHRVDERGLAVVDVGDDGDIAEVVRGSRCVGRRWLAVLERRARRGRGSGGLSGTADCPTEARRPALAARVHSGMTVAAVILSATAEGALADTLGQPRVRRLVTSPGRAAPCRSSSCPRTPEARSRRRSPGPRRSTAPPAPVEDGPPARWSVAPRLALAEVRDTTAVLLWPARMTWVGPETVTSLIEAHGTDRATRSCARRGTASPGWPVLVPVAHLDAPARRRPPTGCRPTSIDDLVDGAPDAAWSRSATRASSTTPTTALADLPPYEGPPDPPAGHTHEWGDDVETAASTRRPGEGRACAPFPQAAVEGADPTG